MFCNLKGDSADRTRRVTLDLFTVTDKDAGAVVRWSSSTCPTRLTWRKLRAVLEDVTEDTMTLS